jgi:hypothetical protein
MKIKKNKLLNLLKLGILFLGITVLLQNCEIDNDEVIETKVSKSLDFKMERVTFKTIEEENSLSKPLSLLDKHLDKKKKTSNFSRKSAVHNDFTILTNDVIKIEKDSIITYTFQVKQNKNLSGFQNFVIQQENNKFYYHLLFYSPNNDVINPSYDVKYTALNEVDLDLSSINLYARSVPAEEIDDGENGSGNDGNIQVCAVVTYEQCSVRGAANGHSPALQFDGSFCSGSPTIVDLSYCPNYSYTGPTDTTNPVDTTPGDNTDTSNSSGGGSSGSSSASSNEVMTAPMLPNGDCPPGFTKNSEGICVAICTNGKTFNAATKKCECPDGKVEDSSGNCVDKPCKGNPIKDKLEVASQKGKSKTQGALQGCTRYGGTCKGTDGRNKFHAGIDIKSSYGNPIYAMYDGFIYSTKFHKKAGYNTRIQSTINGKTILASYFHLQKDNRVLQGTPLVKVKAGDIIGYQGDSGNLKGAIKSGGVDSHIHIEIREHDGSTKWGYKQFNLVDPRSYFSTKIKDDGTSESNTNCK